jgi:hypothetical protein
MLERNIQFGLYGASGLKGHQAIARQLDALAGYITTPITARRGLMARLHYLTRSDRARAATPRTIRAWLAGTRAPSKKNLDRIEHAYRTVRRENVPATCSPASTAKAAAPAWRSTRSTSPRCPGPASGSWSTAR